MLPYWERCYRSNILFHPVTTDWHWPTSPSTDPIMPGVWQADHKNINGQWLVCSGQDLNLTPPGKRLTPKPLRHWGGASYPLYMCTNNIHMKRMTEHISAYSYEPETDRTTAGWKHKHVYIYRSIIAQPTCARKTVYITTTKSKFMIIIKSSVILMNVTCHFCVACSMLLQGFLLHVADHSVRTQCQRDQRHT